MSDHQPIPEDWRVRRSTGFFTPASVPDALLRHHRTGAGVFGQICVMAGTVVYHGFASRDSTEPERTVVIEAGSFTTTPPGYWHRVELSDDAQFNIVFWSHEEAEPDD